MLSETIINPDTAATALFILFALLKLRVVSINWETIATALAIALMLVRTKQQLDDVE
jgi:hypothetical protein